jgi:hypothetical protein
MERSRWDQFKQRTKEIKQYLKGQFIEKGHVYSAPVHDYFETEKYYGPEYKEKRKKRNKEAYKSRKHNSMRRRGKR